MLLLFVAFIILAALNVYGDLDWVHRLDVRDYKIVKREALNDEGHIVKTDYLLYFRYYIFGKIKGWTHIMTDPSLEDLERVARRRAELCVVELKETIVTQPLKDKK